MNSLEWNDAQVRFLIKERKERNSEFHSTPNKKKHIFWEDIAKKINELENTNYFTGEGCRKKFTNLIKAFRVSSTCLGSIKDLVANILIIFIRRRKSTELVGKKGA
jgi:hypothetical protein